MKVIVFGAENRIAEFRAAFQDNAALEIERGDAEPGEEDFREYDLVCDLNFDDDSSSLPDYARLKDKWVLVSAVKQSLAEAVYHHGVKVNCRLLGFNALSGFMQNKIWELSCLKPWYKKDVPELMKLLGKEAEIVEDRVGLVTPRVVCSLINEAAWAMQEKTAAASDMDLAMKLGTNYPYGPLEWADRIGLTDVFETLMSLYHDTQDERYKISPLLKRKYLLNEKMQVR